MAAPELLITLFTGPYAPWLAFGIYLILFATAAWDARTGIVPNAPLFIGAAAWLLALYMTTGWKSVGIAAAWGAGAWFVIWALNELWFRFFGKDAVGMGDAKWTALAIMVFSGFPALAAWFAGAWISIFWIAGSYFLRRPIRKVYFAPFLFCGLTLGLLVMRGVIRLPFPFMI